MYRTRYCVWNNFIFGFRINLFFHIFVLDINFLIFTLTSSPNLSLFYPCNAIFYNRLFPFAICYFSCISFSNNVKISFFLYDFLLLRASYLKWLEYIKFALKSVLISFSYDKSEDWFSIPMRRLLIALSLTFHRLLYWKLIHGIVAPGTHQLWVHNIFY